MKTLKLMPFFDAETGSEGQDTPAKTTDQNTDNATEGKQAEKTFTRDEVAKMIAAETNKAKELWEKEFEAKNEEAKKLAKMNEQEKLQHELEQKDAVIAELSKEKAVTQMKAEASKMLSSSDLPYDEELLSLIVSDDAEATKKAVAIVTGFASKIKKENARQNPPIEGGQFSTSKGNNNSLAELAKTNRII